MGMYTEIYVNVDLKEDTPEEIINILKAICGGNFRSSILKDFPARWGLLFNSGSYYTPNTYCASLTLDNASNQWSLLGKGDIKNYDAEIEKFFEWIMPYIDANEGDFIGYSRYEEDQKPKLFFKKGE